MGSTSGSSSLQSIEYDYNIRGWMTDVNKNQMSVTDLSGKLFSYKIKYTNREGVENPDTTQFSGKNVTAKYNGNIAEVDWRAVETLGANPSLTPKRYGYAYDKLNRLTAGFYQNPNNPTSKENTESLSYDVNGNITNLYRTSILEYGNTTPTLIDNLEYIYDAGNNSNRLSKINDYSYNATGYEGGGQTIGYDVNGNMTDMPDKAINKIKYNYLNLSDKVEYSRNGNESVVVNMKYGTGGEKLQKENITTIIGFNSTVTTKKITDYLDGFQYLQTVTPPPVDPGGVGSSSLMANSETAKALEMQAFSLDEPVVAFGPMGAKTADLQFFPTAEGFYDYVKNQYIYQYKDHLGNVRVSFGKSSAGALEIVDNNDYYPFGMNHLKSGTSFFGTSSYKNYKYNGKELQETGMYDYGARMYMSDIGRWGVIDNYSENYNSMSPYNYVAGNPVKFIDINGEWIYINDQDGTQYRYSNGATQHQVDGKWANIDSSTTLSDFVTQTVAGLGFLESNTSIGKTMIDYFDQGQGEDGKTRDINFNYTSGGSQVRHGISNIVDLNPLATGKWTTSGRDVKYSPLYSTIAHEMGHVYGYFALGELASPDTRFGDDATTAEIYGSHVENIVRGETGLPLRTHYRTTTDGTGKSFPGSASRLIDSVGNSIYYDSSGTQINPIPSINEVRGANNTILQNRYNYNGAAAMYHWNKYKNRGR